ncbi:MAG: serine/threonine protein kinase [Planctomycetia bacterium]|nr:serine/threonine protein kinase [Planctomycetia bacterium]
MPAPTTVPELLDRLRKSGLVPADRLEGFLAELQTANRIPASPPIMLERLVEAGLITRFHAEKLATGKYKGFQLGSYLILDQLGSGGMGQVFLAEHAHMRRLVALKVFPPNSYDMVARERFFREARAAGTLDHPNIMRVFDLCQEGKLLYLVMEYVEGVSLQTLVGHFGPLEVATACHYARQVAFGLHHAHEMGFVHRDIKPANLLLDRAGLVKILDLGLVRSEADAASGLTKQFDNKSILGTADYVAPEQAIDSSKVDSRADIYSLGATLYFLLTGRPLFPGGRTAQKLVWQQIKEPMPVDGLRPEVSRELAAVVHRMLQKRPSDRFRTAAEVFDALAPFDSDDIPLPNPSLLPEPAARVAMARGTTPAPASSRTTGSTSHIVVAALRTGTGSSSGIRKGRTGDSVTDSGKLAVMPSSSHNQIPTLASQTDAVAADDTQRTPQPDRVSDSPTPSVIPAPMTLIVALAVALALALLGIVILLLRT